MLWRREKLLHLWKIEPHRPRQSVVTVLTELSRLQVQKDAQFTIPAALQTADPKPDRLCAFQNEPIATLYAACLLDYNVAILHNFTALLTSWHEF